MSVLLKRGAGFETVEVQAPTGVDRQGLPAYAVTPTEINARAVRETQVIRRPDGSGIATYGSEIATFATLWVDAGEPVLPLEEYRVTLADGLVGIVVERMEGRGLGGALNHVRLRLRRE